MNDTTKPAIDPEIMDKIFNEFWDVCDNLPNDYDWAVDPLGILE